jgi:predicted RecA/RadA family phage recombinase
MSVYVYQSGRTIDYTPTSAVTAGDVVVQNNLIGVATLDIAANDKGSLMVEGVVRAPSNSASISAGVKIYWDSVQEIATTSSSQIDSSSSTSETPTSWKYMGKSIKAATTDDSYVKVLLAGASNA